MDKVKTKDEAKEIILDFIKSWKDVKDPIIDLIERVQVNEIILWHGKGKYTWVVPDRPDRLGYFSVSVSSDRHIMGYTSAAGKVQPWEIVPFP